MTPTTKPDDQELDELERRLMRSVLIRRLVIGIGGIAVGLACLALAVLLEIQGGRMIRTAMVSAIIGLIAIGGGFVTLRVGEIREDLTLHAGSAPVPWKTIALASSCLALALMAVAAWPLGVYRRIGALASPCRKVITSQEMVALGGAPFDVDEVEDLKSMCELTGIAPGTDAKNARHIIQIRIDKPNGHSLANRRDFFAPTRKERLDGGDEAWLFERRGAWMVAVSRADMVTYVQLSSPTYDETVVRKVAEKIIR